MIVMCVCHFDETNAYGGLEKQAKLLSQTLMARGRDLIVLASTRRFLRKRRTDANGLTTRFFWTYTTPQVSGKKLPASLIWALQVLAWTYWHRKKITAFHSHQIRIHAFVGAIAQKFWGIPHILKSASGGTGADIKTIGSHKYFGRAGRNFIIRNTQAFIATTQSIRDDLREYGVPDNKIKIIPNGMTLPAEIPQYLNRHKRCIFLGRLASDKNVLQLAVAAEQSMLSTDYYLDIYGKGDQQEDLVRLLQDRGMKHVSYKGFVENTFELLPHYGWLLLPSEAEGLSNAMLEAMACGVVPLATRVSGCLDHIIPGETGHFFADTSVQSLADGVSQICATSEDIWRVLSGNVRRYSVARFSIDHVADEYVSLYQRLQGQG